MSEEKQSLARAGTMKVTVKEGIDYLKADGIHDSLLKTHPACSDEKELEKETKTSNGASNENEAEKNLKRKSTMEKTAQEGIEFLKSGGDGSRWGHPSEGEKERQAADEDESDSDFDDFGNLRERDEPVTKKPRMAKQGTMAVTAKEGIDYLKAEGKDRLLKIQGLVDDEKVRIMIF